MNDGWVKLHRQINSNVFLQNDDTAYLIFTKLLTRVNSNGQWAGGRRQLADIMHMSDSTLYKALQRLDREQLILIVSNQRYSTYSICNWGKYQKGGNQQNVLQVTSGEPAGNRSVTNREHSNKNKKENKNKKRAYALPSKIDDELAAKELAAREPRPNAGTSQLAGSLTERYRQLKAKKEATA